MKSKQTIHEVKQFKVSDLHKHPSNPRTLKDTAYNTLKQSIEANPELLEARPLILSNRTGKNIVIGGNQRLQVVKDLGWLHVPCVLFPDMSEEKEREIMIRDNVSNGDWDWDKLANEWDSAELNYWGLEVPDWEQEQEEYEGQTDQDAAPEIEPEAVTQLGDLWLLGEHRLLCGDSTSEDVLKELFQNEVPDIVFSDPPYGIDIVSKGASTVGGSAPVKFGTVDGKKIVDAKKYAQIIGDNSTETAKKFYEICQSIGIENYLIFGGNYFTDFLPPSMCWVVWDKQNSGNFADVELAWTSFKKAAKLYSFMWNGLARSGNRKDELSSRVHPTQKPVGLFEAIFQDFDFKSCFDGFLGSGSTLIACEKTGRKCYGTELSEAYCDVIIKRWQDFSGKQATLEATGETFEEVKHGRAS